MLAGENEARIQDMKQMLAGQFDIKDLGRLTYFISMSVIQDQGELVTWIGQPSCLRQETPREAEDE